MSPALAASALASLVALAAPEAHAAGIIKNPGDHPKYSVELEPHGLLRWDNYYFGDTGYGLGMHAVIPFLDNGPIDKINNNMGIGFGLDWAHFSENACYGFAVRGPFINANCDAYANSFMFPVFVQWNFFFTDIISVFGEAGFGIDHNTATVNYPYTGICPVGYLNCQFSDSHTGVFPYFEGGGRFLFGDTVGLTVRIGFPLFTVGVAILL